MSRRIIVRIYKNNTIVVSVLFLNKEKFYSSMDSHTSQSSQKIDVNAKHRNKDFIFTFMLKKH
jgi:hypothetical protein